MTKLVDQFNTQYFADHFAGDVRTFLAGVDSVDLAGAKICRSVMELIMASAWQGLLVRDTGDPERDALFAENRRRQELAATRPEPTPIYFPASIEEVAPCIRELESEVTYSPQRVLREEECAYLVLAQAARPDVTFDLSAYVRQVFGYLYRILYPNPYRWDEFYVVTGNTFIVRRVDTDDYLSFVRDNLAIPTDFGTKNLYKLPMWEKCLAAATRTLELRLKSQGKHFRDYL